MIIKRQRCPWAEQDQNTRYYHDVVWGTPIIQDDEIFKRLALQVFQSGLNQRLLLRKEQALNQAFKAFASDQVALFGEQKVTELLTDATLIRNRQKVLAVIENARLLVQLQKRQIYLTNIIWTEGSSDPQFNDQQAIPAFTNQSVKLAAELRQLGFRFMGPTNCYALLVTCGVINGHLTTCSRHKEVAAQQKLAAKRLLVAEKQRMID
ncbi:hypothetical protein BSQ39_09150 [Loigolactobacillus backii]|uniref:DNA-3-methyladenine glycosylase I n=1 Tax=Loigolactobacillus backii TaxID=375175 RepID=UPI000C1C9ED4|nr:DNA-3-methyladenine glycosylase I [Loigolactobacillus backii]PIO83720.1 hypothetical protein BSQ39_09150 [Loigolactobacillus backii]